MNSGSAGKPTGVAGISHLPTSTQGQSETWIHPFKVGLKPLGEALASNNFQKSAYDLIGGDVMPLMEERRRCLLPGVHLLTMTTTVPNHHVSCTTNVLQPCSLYSVVLFIVLHFNNTHFNIQANVFKY